MCRVTFEFEINNNAVSKHVLFRQNRDIPKWACLELTSICNFNCKYCYIHEDDYKKALSVPDIKKLLCEIRSAGFIQLSIIGGEPTLHQNFIDTVAFASSLGFIVHICSNGSRIDKNLAKSMKEAGVDQVQINVDHVDPAEHNILRGNKNKNCITPLEALINCRDNGIHTVMAAVVMEENKNVISELMRLAYQNECSAFRVWKRIPKQRKETTADNLHFIETITECIKTAKRLRVKRIKSTSSMLPHSISEIMEFTGCPAAENRYVFQAMGKCFLAHFIEIV